jgi:cation:H+ antiporter
MVYLGLTFGIFLLLFAGDLLVRGAVSLASEFKVPPLVIGLTIVAFGTSAPELVVSVESVLAGHSDLAIGNVVGSNIANVLLVLGVPAIIYPIVCNQPSIRRNTLFMLLVTVLFIFLCFQGTLDAFDGAMLFTLLIIFLTYAFVRARNRSDMGGQFDDFDDIGGLPTSHWKVGAFILLGLIGLPLGAHFTIDAAEGIARAWHVSEAVIGLTVVALGTSMPELATTVIAAMRKHSDLAVGNVLGSNIFNILAILGITTMVRPVAVPPAFLEFDLWVLMGSSLLIAPFAVMGGRIGRLAGIGFLIAYALYIITLLDKAVA